MSLVNVYSTGYPRVHSIYSNTHWSPLVLIPLILRKAKCQRQMATHRIPPRVVPPAYYRTLSVHTRWSMLSPRKEHATHLPRTDLQGMSNSRAAIPAWARSLEQQGREMGGDLPPAREGRRR